ncbi:AAA family ATPase [Galbibacter pacificus]|uniref:AAA family ATPase n=1 Tax=Galbibacter pacificus TaxID=2996052 RepID=A0ABT6FQI0_9FLAO|nr:AAA family ATPase [Galbibacter pacificus]MDG3582001.1 AAA family ATPase [Galbibacter pacificus]MDG3585525.1 AAA family ATPase [Galbibacter pacificus]
MNLTINNNFFVITGGPGVGKTTLLNELKNKNLVVVPEIARELIIEQKHNNGEALPWKNTELYKQLLFDRSIKSYKEVEKEHAGSVPVFFDRGFLDTLCYAKLINSKINGHMHGYGKKLRYNKNVFILPPWKEIYITDGERKQNWEEALLTFKKMAETYKEYHYTINEVPKKSPSERANYILKCINAQ